MMRGDDADLGEIEFLIRTDGIDPETLEAAFQSARVPEIPEIEEIFLASQQQVRLLLSKIRNDPGR
jgi:hypothetical protein